MRIAQFTATMSEPTNPEPLLRKAFMGIWNACCMPSFPTDPAFISPLPVSHCLLIGTAYRVLHVDHMSAQQVGAVAPKWFGTVHRTQVYSTARLLACTYPRRNQFHVASPAAAAAYFLSVSMQHVCNLLYVVDSLTPRTLSCFEVRA
jgi:hypothetical protein